jgi:hypothetical protein
MSYIDTTSRQAQYEQRVSAEALKYIGRIRNTGKYLYAYAYYQWLTSSAPKPSDRDYTISEMAKQAVRLRLDAIVKAK